MYSGRHELQEADIMGWDHYCQGLSMGAKRFAGENVRDLKFCTGGNSY